MSICFGILNVTADSFSDGGAYLEPVATEAQISNLIQSGADWIEVSGQSSNTNANLVSEIEEWERIQMAFLLLQNYKCNISVDSFRPQIQAMAIEHGAHCINDISGFTHVDSKHAIQSSISKHKEISLIVMHSHTKGIAKESSNLTPDNVIPKILEFFRDRKKELLSWGVREDRLYFDPGMGFFLSEDPEVSFSVLRGLDSILEEFPNLMVSVSRKSFLGNALGGLPVTERENVTLTAEIYLLMKKIPWIRTHNVKKLKQAEIILKKLHSLPS